MSKNLIVIDNFYQEPEEILEYALSNYDNQNRMVDKKYEFDNEAHRAYVAKKFQTLINSDQGINYKKDEFGSFVYQLGSEIESPIQNGKTEWLALIGLVNGPSQRVGLTFYRHKETMLMAPPDSLLLNKFNLGSLEEWEKLIFDQDKKRREAWESTMHIEIAFNRLILFRAKDSFYKYFSKNPSPANGNLNLLHCFSFNGGVNNER